jgi:hypothetical protein
VGHLLAIDNVGDPYICGSAQRAIIFKLHTHPDRLPVGDRMALFVLQFLIGPEVHFAAGHRDQIDQVAWPLEYPGKDMTRVVARQFVR